MRQIRLFLVDDQGLVLRAIRLALESNPELAIAGHTSSAEEVLPRIGETRPDIVLLDVPVGGGDGLELLDRLRTRYPKTKVVILCGNAEAELAADAVGRGAEAVIGKGIDPADVAPLVREVAEGRLNPKGVVQTLGPAARALDELGLAEREREILEHLAAGRSNRDIAWRLSLSELTVKSYLTSVYRKLGVAGRSDAADFAREHGLGGRVRGAA